MIISLAKQIFCIGLALLIHIQIVSAQYQFTTEKKLACTEVKNQQSTGTCWSYATTSFMESESMRTLGKNKVDLSEMFVVRKIYEDKAFNYILRQGKANFSQGSLAHDLVRITDKYGIIPESVYSGKVDSEDQRHDHSELENALKGYLDGVLATKKKSNKWKAGVSALLDIYLGAVPEKFNINGKEMTAKSYAKSLDISANDYMHLTSFNHHPYYEKFILEIPDNYSNGSYYNLPIDDLQALTDYALLAGYSISWDGDVSEKGFDARKGLAVLPVDTDSDFFKNPNKEMEVNQEIRQMAFENFSTTDDHLMHIVGISFDQKGNKYYMVKNSWGQISPYKGYLYMSEAYFKMKTVGITLHQDALPKKTADKLLSAN